MKAVAETPYFVAQILLDRLTAAARRSGSAQWYLKGGGAWEARRRLGGLAPIDSQAPPIARPVTRRRPRATRARQSWCCSARKQPSSTTLKA